MQIIGEKINGTRKQVGAAIANRDVEFIQSLARRQAEARSDWLDVNAGTPPEREPDDLLWLVETVQQAAEVPLCLDSANPRALSAVLDKVNKKPLINSITGERQRLDNILPLACLHGCRVIALAMDGKGIPATVSDRMKVIRDLMEQTRAAGLPDEYVYVDPLVMTISTNTNSGSVALDTIHAVHAEFPSVHITAGLSNISFGLPVRALINRTFLTLALAAGLDTAILDPLDRELRAALIATDLVLGRDKHCLAYTRAYRAGRLDAAPTQASESPAKP